MNEKERACVREIEYREGELEWEQSIVSKMDFYFWLGCSCFCCIGSNVSNCIFDISYARIRPIDRKRIWTFCMHYPDVLNVRTTYSLHACCTRSKERERESAMSRDTWIFMEAISCTFIRLQLSFRTFILINESLNVRKMVFILSFLKLDKYLYERLTQAPS